MILLMSFIFLKYLQCCLCCSSINYPLIINHNDSVTYLLESNDRSHKFLNELFTSKYKDYVQNYDSIPKSIKIICEPEPGGVRATIEATKLLGNVINLRVADFYEFNYNILLDEGIYFAGNTAKVPDNSDTNLHSVKLISDSIGKFENLYKAVRDFPNSNKHVDYFERLKANTALICLHKGIKLNSNIKKELAIAFNKINIIYSYESCMEDIKKFEKKLLAILAPSPMLTVNDEILIPTIFYQTQYLLPEYIDIYPNSMTSTSSWQEIKFAFMAFLKLAKWRRVAIVSDDSPHSYEFEKELVALFKKEGIVYTVKECLQRVCDFNEALNSLKQADARVIIANVDERYAKLLSVTAAKYYMTSKYGITWIMRDWLLKHKCMGEYFSVSIGPYINQTTYENLKIKINDNADILHVNRIIDSVARINKAASVNSIFIGDNISYRKFAQVMNTAKQAVAYVTKVDAPGNSKIIATMKLDGELTSAIEHSVISFHPDDNCIVSSNNYHKPCNDTEMVLLLLVGCMTVFMIFIILYFFYYEYETTIIHRQNYVQMKN